MNKILVTFGLLLSIQFAYGQRFQANLHSDNNILKIGLTPIEGDFEELEFAQIEFFIRTSATSNAEISLVEVDVNSFGGNIPITLISDKVKGDYRVFHFGYSTTPSVVRKNYYQGSSYNLVNIELSNVQNGETFELVSNPETFETYLNLTDSKGRDLAPIIEETEEELGANPLFIGERKRKEGNLLLQGTQINLEQAPIETPTLFASNNVSVQTFPNPVTDKVHLQINTLIEQKLQIQVQDINGQVVMSRMVEVAQGRNHVQFNLKQFPTGTYFIHANGKDMKFAHKINVVK